MKNIAFGKNVTSSNVTFNGNPEKAVDGQTGNEKVGDPLTQACSFTYDEPSWIQVDLGEKYIIAALSLVGRVTDDQGDYDHQSKNWTIRIGNSTENNSGEICASDVDAIGGYWVPIFCNTTLKGRYVTISSDREMTLCEIQVLIKYGKIFIKLSSIICFEI